MTAYTPIPNGNIDQDSPVDQPLLTGLRDNPISAFEGEVGAPVTATAWHPFDSTINGTGTGVVYSFAVHGAVASFESPTFADGYEYRFIVDGISSSSGTVANLNCELFRETSAAYAAAFAVASSSSLAAASTGSVYVELPRTVKRAHFVSGNFTEETTNATATLAAIGGVVRHTTAQKISKARFSWAVGNIDAGIVTMQRRRVHY